jgi:hypothetical protein
MGRFRPSSEIVTAALTYVVIAAGVNVVTNLVGVPRGTTAWLLAGTVIAGVLGALAVVVRLQRAAEERERRERERQERERAEQERAELERLASERVERERVAWERAEAERRERERQERERSERERLEWERAERERIERERLRRLREQRERQARERAERERAAQAERERRQAEIERREREEQERAARARAEQEAAERAEQERLAREAHEAALFREVRVPRLKWKYAFKYWLGSRAAEADPDYGIVSEAVRKLEGGFEAACARHEVPATGRFLFLTPVKRGQELAVRTGDGRWLTVGANVHHLVGAGSRIYEVDGPEGTDRFARAPTAESAREFVAAAGIVLEQLRVLFPESVPR